MSRIWRLVWIPVLLGSTIGCHAEGVRSGDGRIDLMIRPDSTAASSRALQASFTLRNLERRSTEHVSIAAPYQTLSIPLPAGFYWLDWQPELSLAESEEVLSGALPAAALSNAHSQPIVVAAGQVTTVNVRASVGSNPEHAELAALTAEAPCVEVRSARH